MDSAQISLIQHGMIDESSAQLSWEDIVFSNRNKDYGAYLIRKDYVRNVITGLIITCLVVGILLLLPAIINFFRGHDEAVIINSRTTTFHELIQPPPIDQKKTPPIGAIPKVKSVIKYVAPKVTEQETKEEMHTIEEIKNSETGIETEEGIGNTLLDEPVDGIGSGEDEIFMIVEQDPEYPGGEEAMMNFISKNTRYPMVAKQQRIQGKVFVSFVVNMDGKISDVSIVRGLQPDCDSEALRVVKSMPPWKPGKQRGKPVRVRFTLPIQFKMNI